MNIEEIFDDFTLIDHDLMGIPCKRIPCPGCQGELLIFSQGGFKSFICCNCLIKGFIPKKALKENTGSRSHRRMNILEERRNFFRDLRMNFSEGLIEPRILSVLGLPSDKHDPVNYLFYNNVIGYTENLRWFRDNFSKKYTLKYKRLSSNYFPGEGFYSERPSLIIPLGRCPGIIDGYTVITDTAKVSVANIQSSSGKLPEVYTFFQISAHGPVYLFDDPVDDFRDIVHTMLFDKDCTVAAKPCYNEFIEKDSYSGDSSGDSSPSG